ncbi:MAG: S8 family serine peptidase [Acidimicrobiales bacterium]
MRRRLMVMAGALVVLVATAVPAGATNDPLFKFQWGLSVVNAPQAWTTSTGKAILIGVVDTGVDLPHEEFAGRVAASTNCVGSNGDVSQCHDVGQDDNGHGSHVAGVAGAATGNGKGIAGMAPDAKLLIAKALDANLTGSIADIAAGIHWVVDHGARVVNLSFGDQTFTQSSVIGPALKDSIEYAWSKGAVPVLASGNSSVLGFGLESYGNIDAVVVGATGRDGAVAGYSSPTGTAKWALLAPGGSADGTPADDVLSTYWEKGVPNAYKTLAGTSMAAPLVSGTLALLLATGVSPAAAVARLLSTVNTKVSCGPQSDNCKGVLDAGAALTPSAPHPTSVTPSTTVPAVAASVAPTTSVPAAPTVPPTAIMNPVHGPPRPAPTVAATVSPTLKDSRAVAVAPLSPVHHGHGSIAWFVALGALFVAAAGGGVAWMVRASPDPTDL